jgi:Icc-related predicted phosphoesterase
MLLCAVGDFHGQVDWLPDFLDQHRPDLLLCVGDWGDPGQLSESQFQAVLARVPTLSIWGNHDDRELLARLRNRDGTPVLLEDGAVRQFGGIGVAGISGIWAKTRLGARLTAQWEKARHRDPDLTLEAWLDGRPPPPYVTDEVVAAAANVLAQQPVDVLITHGCPVGLADLTPGGGRGGQRCFRLALEQIRPRIHLCGHLHRFQRADLPDGRMVLNTGSGAERCGWWLRGDAGGWEAWATL